MKEMADRISSMRKELKQSLADNGNNSSIMKCMVILYCVCVGSTHDWSHVTKQIGMFCYSGLTQAQVREIPYNGYFSTVANF